jgi:hypothetical protein
MSLHRRKAKGSWALGMILIFAFAATAQAINLVPNPSFESYSQCPPGPFNFAGFVDVWTVPTGGSPDYYNACAGSSAPAGVPANSFGNQAARTGNAYAGFILRSSINNYREYVEVQLTAPLTGGKTYHVSFYVSLSDQSQWAIDQVGAFLSIGPVGPVSNALPLPVVPQLVNPTGNYITNKAGWTLVSGTYVALGGEDHLVIGNFSDNASTTAMTGLGGFYPGAYYYLDDVSVSEEVACSQNGFDHLECIEIDDKELKRRGFSAVINLDSPQFGSLNGCTIKEAIKLCVPAKKSVVSAVIDGRSLDLVPINGQNLCTDFLCYKLEGCKVAIPDKAVVDQFATSPVKFKGKSLEVCTPAKKVCGSSYPVCGGFCEDATEVCQHGQPGFGRPPSCFCGPPPPPCTTIGAPCGPGSTGTCQVQCSGAGLICATNTCVTTCNNAAGCPSGVCTEGAPANANCTLNPAQGGGGACPMPNQGYCEALVP